MPSDHDGTFSSIKPNLSRPERWFVRALDWLYTLTHHREIARTCDRLQKQKDHWFDEAMRESKAADDLREKLRRLEASPERATEGLPDDGLLHWTGPDATKWSCDADPMADTRPPQTITAREPGHAKAPNWDNQVRTEVRRRRRATDWQPANAKPLGATRGDPCFRTTRSQMDGSRRSGRLMYVKTDRFDRAPRRRGSYGRNSHDNIRAHDGRDGR